MAIRAPDGANKVKMDLQTIYYTKKGWKCMKTGKK